MNLTPENIASIERFVTDAETMTAETLGIKYSFSAKASSAASVANVGMRVLRALGISVGRIRAGSEEAAELAEFRAWKAAQSKAKSP